MPSEQTAGSWWTHIANPGLSVYSFFAKCTQCPAGWMAGSWLIHILTLPEYQRIGIKIEANANLYIVGIETYWQIPRQFLYSISLSLTLPLPLQTYIVRKRDSYYTVVWEAAEKLMALVWFFLGGGGENTNKCMPRNPSIGRYFDNVKVCIGFYLDSYSLMSTVRYLC
jgi:hypothetical protein